MKANNISKVEYLANFELETARLLEVELARLDQLVPQLDDWTVRAVLTHTAQVLYFGSLCLTSEPDEPPRRSSVPKPPEGDDIVAWLGQAVEAAHGALVAADLDALRPTWAGPRPASWYLRRLTHEVSVHRWDAQAAWMEPVPIDTQLAIDGIDELLEVYVPSKLDLERLAGSGETVHLHATDSGDGEWFLTYGKGALRWEHVHAKGDVAAKGTASDLLLMLWGRIAPERLEIFGDRSLLQRWQAAARF